MAFVKLPKSQIDATGASDVSDDLNDYINGLPDNTTVLFPAGAKYKCENIIQITDKNDFKIKGNGALIFATTDGSNVTPPVGDEHAWPRTRSHVRITGGTNIAIRNLNIKGANPNAGQEDQAYVSELEAQQGIELRAVNVVDLFKINITDIYGDFVYLGGTGGVRATNVHIHYSRFERNGRQGIAIVNAEDITIEFNFLDDMRRAIFDLEPNTATGAALNVIIRNNIIGPSKLLFLASAGRGPNVSFELENNICHSEMSMVVNASDDARRGPIRVVGNVSDKQIGAPVPAMRFKRVDGLYVHNNVQPCAPEREMTGVYACESTGVSIGGNTFVGAAQEYEVVAVCP